MGHHSRPFVCHNYRHWVYRLYDGDTCLYVGMTKNLDQRLASHRSGKPWWPQVDRVESEWYYTRSEAMIYEEGLIQDLDPVHNVNGRGYRRG